MHISRSPHCSGRIERGTRIDARIGGNRTPNVQHEQFLAVLAHLDIGRPMSCQRCIVLVPAHFAFGMARDTNLQRYVASVAGAHIVQTLRELRILGQVAPTVVDQAQARPNGWTLGGGRLLDEQRSLHMKDFITSIEFAEHEFILNRNNWYFLQISWHLTTHQHALFEWCQPDSICTAKGDRERPVTVCGPKCTHIRAWILAMISVAADWSWSQTSRWRTSRRLSIDSRLPRDNLQFRLLLLQFCAVITLERSLG